MDFVFHAFLFTQLETEKIETYCDIVLIAFLIPVNQY